MSQTDVIREKSSLSPSLTSSETQTGHASPVPESISDPHSKIGPTIEDHDRDKQSAGDTVQTAETDRAPGTDEDAQTPEPMPEDDTLGSSKDPLEEYSWAELEERFAARMEECRLKEEEIGKEFQEWLEVFKAWTSVTSIHEEERASKRLRTRITYVQDKETALDEKRQHYVKVVRAFESALALMAE